METFVQFLVLIVTVVFWWLARRDLTARAAEARAPEIAELERLRLTVEALTEDLERRAEAAERRIGEAENRIAPRIDASPPLSDALSGDLASGDLASGSSAAAQRGDDDMRYAPIYALAASGVTDPTEIARRTGFGRGEVELILGLRARRAL